MWFKSWGRYAWNPEADPEVEQQYWTQRLSERFGTEAAPRVLSALEANADVLPAIQRLIWLGNDNHTVVGAGITLEQIQKAQGIPFLPLPDTVRIPAWIEALKKGEKVEGESPVAFLSRKVEAAETAAREAEMAARAATRNQDEVARLETDAQAVVWVARFYRDKLKAAIAKSLADAQMDAT
jgi:hypothetical protein